DAVHDDAETARPDGLGVDVRQFQDAAEMGVEEVLLPVCAELLVRDGGGARLRLGHRQDGPGLAGVEELALRVEQLEGVPLGRVVRGRENDRPRRPCLQNGHRRRGRRGHAGVHHVAAGALERGGDEAGADVARRAPVAPHDDEGAVAAGGAAAPRPEGGGVADEHGGVEAVAEDAPDARDGGDERHGEGEREKREARKGNYSGLAPRPATPPFSLLPSHFFLLTSYIAVPFLALYS